MFDPAGPARDAALKKAAGIGEKLGHDLTGWCEVEKQRTHQWSWARTTGCRKCGHGITVVGYPNGDIDIVGECARVGCALLCASCK